MFEKAKEFLGRLFGNKDTKQEPQGTLKLDNERDYKALTGFFKANAYDSVDNELFKHSLIVARQLGVEVEFTHNIFNRSFYLLNENKITIETNQQSVGQAQDLLHELIHATTRKAFMLYKSNPTIAKELFTQKQINAFKDIEKIFENSKKKFDDMSEADFQSSLKLMQGKGLLPKHLDISLLNKANFNEINYGYKSVDEFIAELANPIFREHLKTQSLWDKVKNAVSNFFFERKELDKIDTIKALKERYLTILDEYNVARIGEIKAFNFDDISFSQRLEAVYLDKRTDRIRLNALMQEATELPENIDEQAFKKQFPRDENGYFLDTPIGRVRFENLDKTYEHFDKNTYFDDRKWLSGAFVEVLNNPLFVVRQKYPLKTTALDRLRHSPLSSDSSSQKQRHQSASGESKTESIIANSQTLVKPFHKKGNEKVDSYVFFKPYKKIDENNTTEYYYLASFAIDMNGKLLHKTFFDFENNFPKIEALIKGLDKDLLYFKGEKFTNAVFDKEKSTERNNKFSSIMENFNKTIADNKLQRSKAINNTYKAIDTENSLDTPKNDTNDNVASKIDKLNKIKKPKR